MIAACEEHLDLMNDARLKIDAKPHAFRDLAVHLRVLVCQMGRNRPLLLDLIDRHSFTAIVKPAGPPCPQFILSKSFSGDPNSLSLREFIQHFAVHPPEYTVHQFVVDFSSQLSAHEDVSLTSSVEILRTANVKLWGLKSVPLHSHLMVAIYEQVYEMGNRFIKHMVANNGYSSRVLYKGLTVAPDPKYAKLTIQLCVQYAYRPGG